MDIRKKNAAAGKHKLQYGGPEVTLHVTQIVRQCTTHAKETKQKKELLMPTDLPNSPWQVVGKDLFEIKGIHYLIKVDFFFTLPRSDKTSIHNLIMYNNCT